jgi:hypothetical protein
MSAGSAVEEDGKVMYEAGDSTLMFHLLCVINRGSYVIIREHGREHFPDAAS